VDAVIGGKATSTQLTASVQKPRFRKSLSEYLGASDLDRRSDLPDFKPA
jgi:hypothetical protein